MRCGVKASSDYPDIAHSSCHKDNNAHTLLRYEYILASIAHTAEVRYISALIHLAHLSAISNCFRTQSSIVVDANDRAHC